MAIFDMIGVASILPFITVLVNPEIIETNFILKNIFEKSKLFGVKNNQDFFFSTWNNSFFNFNHVIIF